MKIKRNIARRLAFVVSDRRIRSFPNAAKNALRSSKRLRFGLVSGVSIIVLGLLVFPYLKPVSYELGSAANLLSTPDSRVSSAIKYDQKKSAFTFDNGQQSSTIDSKQTGSSHAVSTVHKAGSNGVTVSDSDKNTSFTMKPHEVLADGQKQSNRIVFPMRFRDGAFVYSVQTAGVKEDILLFRDQGDSYSTQYDLNLGKNMTAKLMPDGSVGVFGNGLLASSITAGSDADAKLLEKARQNAKKNTLMFSLPKPVVLEAGKRSTSVKSSYELSGNRLTIRATGLSKAAYPLSIDPSIYVATAEQFMFGNNETNINFDVTNKLIKKGRTTGARFDSWKTTTSLPNAVAGGGAVAAGGYIYNAGGSSPAASVYNSQGSANLVIPDGVTSITVKVWGGGGGGGGGSGGLGFSGGSGGGAGFTQATISVTPGETLTTYVGGGGNGGNGSPSASGNTRGGGGGGGGGYSSIYRGSTPLLIAAGGGGAGGAYNVAASGANGVAGGAGGGTSGVAGTTSGTNNGGGGGTQSAGGSGGTSGGNSGSAGSSLTGGAGANGSNQEISGDGSGVSGGLASGGNGGLENIGANAAGGGGGGAGYFGGGGGSAANGSAASGGGGGSSYIVSGASSTSNTAGSGTSPGNSGDSSRSGAGSGGAGGGQRTAGTKGSNGLIYVTYGGGNLASNGLYWAKLNNSTGTIDGANPGSGTCSGWCATSAYNLPAGRYNSSMVAYNGFLYVMGGRDSGDTAQSTVYIAKLGANGEPQLWHPTSTTKSSWTYWYQDTALPSVRSEMSMVAYNNRMYLVGGRNATGPVNTVQVADIKPNGTLGSWSSGTNLPYNVYGHGAQIYNDRLYLIGGATSVGGAALTSVYYNKINSDGTLNTWVQTTSLTNARFSAGGNFSIIWGGYLYVNGGCDTLNASGFCTNIRSDTQVASINADGTLDAWNSLTGVSSQRTGASVFAWRDRIYTVGGCSSQDSSNGSCIGNTLSTSLYGDINNDGDASTVSQSVASGTAPCSGATPTSCNLPGTSSVGNMLNASVIANGYLYVIGGCTNNGCTTTSGNVAYTAISASGALSKPATCPNGSYQGGSWCVDTVNTISGGLAAASPVVFNNRIYLVGGLNGTSNTNTIVRTSLNSDGSISAWQSQLMTDVGATSVSYLYAYARANPADASTNPGNVYLFGGCTVSSGAGCTGYTQNVYKCNIQAAGTIAGCSTTGQLQIGTIPGDSQSGLAIMSGTVYANYVYLIGGVSPNQEDLKTLRYAKIDDSNNIVTTGSSGWTEAASQMTVGRRRAASFGYNGYIYVVGGYEATSGVLADIEFIKVNVNDGSLGESGGGFSTSAVQINQRWGLSVPVSNSYAYVIGGCTSGASPGSCTARTDTIQTFQIYNNDSGATAGWTTSANNYFTNRIGVSAAVLNGYMYVAGGCTSTTDCTTATAGVNYAPIDANGSIGTWTVTTALPSQRTWGKLVAAGNSLYYLGGQDSTATNEQSTVYYATPSSGAISSWANASNALPSARTKLGATVWNNRIYVVGGLDSNATPTSTIFVSPQLTNGGDVTSAWTQSSNSFAVARSSAATTAYANNLYLFGGDDGTNYFSDSQYTKINTDGSLSTWKYSASLPAAFSGGDVFAANGYMYLVSGRSDATTCNPTTFVAPVSGNTSVASGNNPTGLGEWFTANQRYSGSRYGGAAVYSDGKAYLLGGACGSTLTYPSPIIQQTSLLSQPQIARYSIMMDTDTDVYPTRWLVNGVDNSIGAKWQLKYRSMTNYPTTACASPAMTTWGQETDLGDITLGLPGVYTPKDGSGASTGCARFYYFNVSVDVSKAFGYPEDVSRGPTITDLTLLQFTTDPSKHLMHGRTFTGGLQQPIDTPYYAQ